MKLFYFSILMLLLVGLFFTASHPAVAQSGCIAGFEEISPGVKVPCKDKTPGPAGETTAGGVILSIINIALLIIGSLTVLFLIVGGFRYITASGSEEQVESAKKMLRNSLIGLVIVILSFVVVSAITNILIFGTPF